MEKLIKPMSGYLALLIAVFSFVAAIFSFANVEESSLYVVLGVALMIATFFILKGLMIINPNHSRVLNFFGKYVGTVKENGLFFVNPLYSTIKISLRSDNLQGQTLKVNDKMGNPIAAVRHLAGSFPYDNLEDEGAEITLREGGDTVNHILEQELSDRLAPAGVIIKEARISHLAYASEIAGAMLQRQQAAAIVAARAKIVDGAVGMVEMALHKLSEKDIVELDNEKKAAMVSNLMVVLCGEKAATPIVNTGTLYQ